MFLSLGITAELPQTGLASRDHRMNTISACYSLRHSEVNESGVNT